MSTMPRPQIPFKAIPLNLSDDDDNEAINVSALKPKPSSNSNPKLIALLVAKGVGYNQIIELLGEEAKHDVEKAKQHKDISKWINAFSARLNETVEQRIKKASQTALDKLLDILNSPQSAPKEILAAARDILDRELGKAKQQVEFSGIVDSSEDLKSIVASTKAVEDRLKELEDKRNRVKQAFITSKPIIDV